MFAVDVCNLPETGGSTLVVIFGLFMLIAGVIVARWVRASAGRVSVVVAPLVLLGGFVLAPQVTDPCTPATTTVPSATTTVPSATTTVPSATTTVPSATTTVPSATTTVPSATTTVPSATTTVPSATTTVPSATTTVAPTTTTTTTTTLAPLVYQVGDPGPSGGIIFYKDLNRPAGSQYFEVACAGWPDGSCGGPDSVDPQLEWGCDGALITGADGTAIGTGEQNTTDIVTGCPTSGIAARRANDLTLGLQSDWFLPSKDELNVLCKWAHVDTVNTICNNDGSGSSWPLTYGDFSMNYYWSSSEVSSTNASSQGLNDGFQTTFNGKTIYAYVRPIRAF